MQQFILALAALSMIAAATTFLFGAAQYKISDVFPDGANSPHGREKIRQFKIALAMRLAGHAPHKPLFYDFGRNLEVNTHLLPSKVNHFLFDKGFQRRMRYLIDNLSEWAEQFSTVRTKVELYVASVGGGETFVLDCTHGRGIEWHERQIAEFRVVKPAIVMT
jgi:hypothetical protein